MAIAAFLAPVLSGMDKTIGLLVVMLLWLIAGLGLASGSPTFTAAAGHIPGVSTAWAVSRLTLMSSMLSIMAKTMMGALVEGVGVSYALFFPISLAIMSAFIAAGFAQRAKRAEIDSVAPVTAPMPIIVLEEDEDRK
jgi:hypothetical protein